MINEIRARLNKISNPSTGKSFETEDRWKHVSLEGDRLVAEYNRDGISPAEKRVVEKEIQEILADLITGDNILVKTTSSKSQDVFKALDKNAPEAAPAAPTEPAQLKTGHGTVGNKKPVPGVGKIIAIGSGKGGVGKSTFTANLAISLAKNGHRVGVIDADIYGPSLPMILGKREEKPRSNSERKIIPVESFGIRFMSFGFFINEQDPVIWRGPMLGGVLNQFLFDVDWQGTDFLLIDLPPGTGDIQLSMIQNAHVDGAIIISTPQDIALLDAKKGLEMFKKLNLPIIGMVENMSSFICTNCGTEHHIFGEGGVAKAVEQLQTQFLGQIPLELELRTGSDKGQPYMAQEEFRGRPVWKGFEAITARVEGFFNPQAEPPKGGFFSKILGLGK
ncbi:MAG TPA: Mrp/NBP35 family ATP-binding protein [Bacteriovoracaceae bacterium]|nr:Mrp/NBP35 family ATP-binding protein [Bacteriovoracaceae bacterium]